ncbi:hypothetical protein N7481_011764 [Penicillium waksmanii]|uniref:uncharacterized protein n=1 Tax=Penicillium waksmanii TaxID=69791 RepID=UPI0025487715|nr:uncharacterized protein N7481_011764 [Penicillium waksmanii]KAJ5974554.1 hypothetical protein N7481_011764 [Penicillium waksmanii]
MGKDKERFQIISDLHLESPAAYDVFQITPKAPYLCLLGDIGYVKDDGFFTSLRSQLEVFRLVFLVFGNHEPYLYHRSWIEAKQKLESFKNEIEVSTGQALGKFVILNQTRYDITSDITLLGCTLFSKISEEQIENVNFGLNDYYHIDDWTVDDHQKAHLSDLAWLNLQLDPISTSEPDRKVIVRTHYCHTANEMANDPRHATSRISSGFITDLTSEPCWQSATVRVWAFDHTHFNCDYQDREHWKRVISSQRGYYFAQAKGFDIEKVVEV